MTPTLTLTPTRTAPRQHADAAQFPADPLRAFIDTCLRRKQTPLQIVGAVKDTFGIEIDYGQVIPCWKGEITLPIQTVRRQDADKIALPTQTAHRQDTDEIALPTQTAHRQDADEIAFSTQTARRQDADEITLPTQTEHRPDKESVQFQGDAPQEPLFTRMADGEAALVPFSIAPDPDPDCGGANTDDAPTTQTGRRQDAKSLPDTFYARRRLAC